MPTTSPSRGLLSLSLLLPLLCVLLLARGDDVSHSYKSGEPVELWVNKVGPFRNPQETYEYYSLPYCKPDTFIAKGETFGEALTAYELYKSRITIHYGQNQSPSPECSGPVSLNAQEVADFKHAVDNEYWSEMFIDDLPVWGMIGQNDTGMIYTHKTFHLHFNADRIIEVNVEPSNAMPLKVGFPFEFTYSVDWEPTTDPFEERFDRYLDNKFFEHQIHWFSIFNSFLMVIFLVGLVAMILMRTLRRDMAKFAEEFEEEVEVELDGESGWKQVHGDVFRSPARLTLFSAMIGSGAQLLVISFLVILASIVFYHNHPLYRRGTVITIATLSYAFTSFISGYISGSYYAQNSGIRWKRTMLYTSLLFPGVLFVASSVLNLVAIMYGSMASIAVSTFIYMILLWGVVSVPLTFAGTFVGRSFAGKPQFPHGLYSY
eukprot:TRINITY_DN3797_c0_g1_i2.p1 TRINITY_DN3797_c0_g1~~TRINITY_DN3797_c0_g1_i2.p1  ORF type:complete len:439 (-),score=62.94 TRINITY_DN3797_c0_g1_i2:108-1403(-)